MSASKRKFRLLSAVMLLVVIAIFWFLPTTVQAETVTQYGIAVETTTDKTDYATGDTINAKVRITNTNQTAVEDVTLELTLPEGFVLQSGGPSLSTGALASGETKEFSLAATVSLGTSTSASTQTSQAAPATAGHQSPQTGDGSPLLLLSLLGLAAVVLLVLVIRYRKKIKGLFALFLCLPLLGSALAFAPVQVQAQAQESTPTFDQAIQDFFAGNPTNTGLSVIKTSENSIKFIAKSHGEIYANLETKFFAGALFSGSMWVTSGKFTLEVSPSPLTVQRGQAASVTYYYTSENFTLTNKVNFQDLTFNYPIPGPVSISQGSSPKEVLVTGLEVTPVDSPVMVGATFTYHYQQELTVYFPVYVTESEPLGGLAFAESEYIGYVGEPFQIVPTATGPAVGQQISFTTNNPDLLQVEQDGTVTGTGVGQVTLTATTTGTDNETYTADATVNIIELGGIVFNSQSYFVNRSSYLDLSTALTITGSFVGQPIVWSSDNENVVTVSQTGLVTSVGATNDFANITASVTNAYGVTRTATCKMTISGT
ncbi:DUF11 domain-containing protein [Ruminococcaceae bacterium OttesenSCG-928-I18]|nr:DUF11 domain-containing protein [Ruminococcaceae bacterium OttesenSCG-928-I18]